MYNQLFKARNHSTQNKKKTYNNNITAVIPQGDNQYTGKAKAT